MERAPVYLWMCLWKIVLIVLINVGGPSSLWPADAGLHKKRKLSINHSRVYYKTLRTGVSLLGFHFRVLPWLLALTSLRSGLWAETNPLPTGLPLVSSNSSSSRKETEQTPKLPAIPLEALSPPRWDLKLVLKGACETTQTVAASRKGRGGARMVSMSISRYFHLHSNTSTLDTSGYVTEACSGTWWQGEMGRLGIHIYDMDRSIPGDEVSLPS